ncbi:unnamed protein product, partial [Meganyctiphanes norvegica]
MTVTYSKDVATSHWIGNFWKLLFRWRGSVYKLIWVDLLAYCILYGIISATYRFGLDADQRTTFEKLSTQLEYLSSFIPISFLLGFYVSIVVTRWWNQYLSIPWPDSLALHVTAGIHGHDDVSRKMRRTIMRYANLSITLTLAMMSPIVKKRFHSLQVYVDFGLMTENEKRIFENFRERNTKQSDYWLPLVWSTSIVNTARREGKIQDDFAVKTLIDKIGDLRGTCGSLLSYDWINVPLVYTQVVTIAVFTFFATTLLGRQFLDPAKGFENSEIDFYIPIVTILQLFFYVGWLKVAETLLNPFGGDDDDFEVNYLIDRNHKYVYLVVDEMHSEHPELLQDKYWDKESFELLNLGEDSQRYTLDTQQQASQRPEKDRKTQNCAAVNRIYL